MGYQTIEVHNSTPHIGAEIQRVDLSNPLGNQQFQEVHDALMDRLVIFFRDQKLGIEQHKDFGRRFGKLHMHPASPDVLADHPEVLVIKRTTKPSTSPARIGIPTYRVIPSRPWARSSISPKCLPTAAATRCSPTCTSRTKCCRQPIRKLIDELTAVHDGEKHYRGRYGNDDRGKVYPRAEHPIVSTHPETGNKCLFVNRFFTTHIVGLRKNESDAILEMLYRHIETPELSMRLKWTPNSVAFWDNRCTQHHALWDYYPHRRYGHRVTVCGHKPS
jgi:taurine dioxygenase